MHTLSCDHRCGRAGNGPPAPLSRPLLLLACLAVATTAGAVAFADNAEPIGPPTFVYDDKIPLTPEQHRDVVAAVTHIYNFEFDQAIREATLIAAANPRSPLGDLLLAEAYWWQAINNLDRPELVAKFRDHAMSGIATCEKILDRDERDTMALFALGGLHGRKAILDGLTGKRLETVNTAVKARKYLRLLNRHHPEIDDAYFGLGVYDYFAAELPWFARILSKFLLGLSGDRERGLAEMERAARNGLFTQVDARIFLSIAYLDTEGRYEEALTILKGLNTTYPKNLDFYGMLGFAYRTEKDHANAISILEAMAEKAKTEPAFGRQSREMTAYFLASTYKVAGLFDRARPILDAILADPNPETEWLTATALLERGRINDAEGQRAAAITDYKRVFEVKEFRNSHQKAKDYLAVAYVVPMEERSHYLAAGLGEESATAGDEGQSAGDPTAGASGRAGGSR